MREELIAAADGEHWQTLLHAGPQWLSLLLAQVAGNLVLLFILSAADEKQVVGRWIQRVAQVEGDDVQCDAAPATALLERHDVTAVAVDVELLWIEVTKSEVQLPQHGRVR